MKLLTAAILIIISSNIAFAQPLEPRHSGQSTDLVETWHQIQALYPRHEASAGETATRELIIDRLQRLGISFSERTFASLENAHSFSRIIEATIAGQRRDHLIIAVPLNHRYGATRAGDGSVGLALALELAAQLADSPPPLTVTLLFLGAEREPIQNYPLGSRHFLSDWVADRPTALVYLDLQQPGDKIVLDSATSAVVAPSWLLHGIAAALAESTVAFDAQPVGSQIQRIGLARQPAQIAPYLQAGMPAIGIRSSAAQNGRHETVTLQPAESLLDGLTRFIDNFAGGMPPGWDRHYVFFQAGNSLLIVGEQHYLLIFLALIAATLFYTVAFRRRFERYARTVLRNLWSIPAIFALLFVLLLAATAVIESFLDYRSYPDLWHHRPLLFFALKISIAVFLFALSMLPLRRSLLASTSSFYSASTIMVLFIGIVTLAVVHISLTYYFLWAFFWAFLFAILPTRPLKVICLIVAPLPLLYTAYVVYTTDELNAAGVFLLSPIGGNLLLALISLPFLLMLLRLDFLVRHPRVGRRSFVLKLSASLAAVTVALLAIVLYQYQPYSRRSPQPLTLHETIDLVSNSRTIDVRSVGPPLEMLPLTVGSEQFIWNGSAVQLPLHQDAPLSVTQRRSSFLERYRLQFIVSSQIELYTIRAQIVSDAPILLYDANFPVSTDSSLERASLLVGVLPPDPLTIDITLPETSRGEMLLRATSRSLSQPVTVSRPDVRIEATELTVRLQTDLQQGQP